jgi:lipopolysaccharide transport system ATP-binding protein
MSDTVIKVENLSKRYRIGAKEGYKTFRETLVDAARAPIGKLSRLFNRTSDLRPPTSDSIWALKDVSFEVNRGEVVGIIGRNGAGKSTLLKILSKITEPTSGRVELRGRVGSLLEVGTGFHPELTGHENIYLYGAILGMNRWEVTRKFDEIVAFAELEKFIDTPVKRYSSGMYMRLAFSVAAHLEPEILLVDEVLAVGDTGFQKKCMGKMGDVSTEGRTVLFVSHNMTVVENVCSRCILLYQGAIAADGQSSVVISRYIESAEEITVAPIAERKDRTGNGRIRFTRFEAISPFEPVRTGKDVRFRLSYSVCKESVPLRNVAFSFSINTLAGSHLLVFSSEETNSNISCIQQDGYLECVISFLPLAAGIYSVNLYAAVNGIVADYLQNAALLNVNDADYYAGGGSRNPSHPLYVAPHYWIRSLDENR